MIQTLKCFLIEDEPLAIRQLESFIGTRKTLELVDIVDDVENVAAFLPKLMHSDILFLDIQVKGGNINTLASYIVPLPHLIVISALPPEDYPEFIKNRHHFVLQKPITPVRFNACITTILKHTVETNSTLT
jgi:DNA-binding LytR/AlgR family response regulator